jgi:TetR/AcrR family transcriptional regulator
MTARRTTTSRGPGRPRNPVGRKQLLTVARQAFAELGYAGASMSDIASRGDIRKSSLFHHFPSKEQLYLEVLSETLNELGSLVLEAASQPGDFLDRLDRLGGMVVVYLGTHPAAARLLLRELVGGGPLWDSGGSDVIVRTLSSVSAFLQRGMEDGLIATQDPHQLTMSIVGMHLMWFATPMASSALIGESVFSADNLARRKQAVVVQIRRICGARPTTR